MGLIRIVYYSERDQRLGLDMLALHEKSLANNTRDEIGGFLHYNGHYFLQVLEGDTERVTACFQKIMRDPRHGNIVLIGAEPIEARSFALWSMGVNAGMQFPTKDVFLTNFAASRVDPAIAATMNVEPPHMGQ